MTGKEEPERRGRAPPTPRYKITPENFSDKRIFLFRAPVINRPKGASLLYVNSFCVEVFGPGATLEICRHPRSQNKFKRYHNITRIYHFLYKSCRAELKSKCNIELTSWFTNSPTESKDVLAQVQVILGQCGFSSYMLGLHPISGVPHEYLSKETFQRRAF